jgi:hypothetical protein
LFGYADIEKGSHQALGFGDDIIGMTELAIGLNRAGGQAQLDVPNDQEGNQDEHQTDDESSSNALFFNRALLLSFFI